MIYRIGNMVGERGEGRRGKQGREEQRGREEERESRSTSLRNLPSEL